MRKSQLFNATAVGLVMAASLIATGGALAETSITTATTAPVRTATIATGGSPDDIKITSTGSIKLTSGTAVTIDSNHKFVAEGGIDMAASASGSTAILVDGGRTSDIKVSSTIRVTDDYAPSDTDTPTDGILDGPFAQGTGRYGLRSTGATPFIGNVEFTSASTVLVEGNDSYGVRFENALNGNFTFDGTMAVVGTNTRAFSFEDLVTGKVLISGSSSALGENASVLNVEGGINGALIIDGALAATGYRLTTQPTDDNLAKLQPEDFLQAGPLVHIASNITGGILLQSAIPDTDTADTAKDEDGNGINDAGETTSNLTVYGSAPALLIGSSTGDITLGAIDIASTAKDLYKSQEFGLVVRGTINTTGVYDGKTSTGIQTGGLGHAVTFENGILITGGVTTVAQNAEGRAVSLLSGTNAAEFNLKGAIRTTTSAKANQTGYGLYIGSGANVPEVNIDGSIVVGGFGTTANATAIFDGSNSLVRLNNTGAISASITPADENEDQVLDTATHRPVAIDLSGNTVGVTIIQTDLKPDDNTVAAPYILGDIKLGSGADSIQLKGGVLVGNIDFGAGANSLTVDEGAQMSSKLSGTGTIDIDVIDGRLELAMGTSANLSELNVREDGALRFILDTTAPTVPMLISSGAATFADGASIELNLNKIVREETRYTLLTASSVSLGNIDVANLDERMPFLYKAALATNTGNTSLFADVRVRTQAETGLSAIEYSAFDAVLTSAQGSDAATRALLAPFAQSDFLATYTAFLPDYSGETLLSLAKSNDALNQTLASQSFIPPTGENQYWLQEYGYKLTRDRGDVTGFETTGYSFAGGVERGLSSTQAAGLYLGYTAATPTDSFATAEEDMVVGDLSLGVYWRMDAGNLKSWVRGSIGRTSFESTRQILEPQFIAKSEAEWTGLSYSGSLGASYRLTAGFLSLTPMITADYFGLKEEAHSETGGGTAFDLSVEERNSHMISGSAILNVGRSNAKALLQPQFWVGYRNNFSVEIDDTIARFGTATPFTLNGGLIEGGGPVAGLRMAASNDYSYFGLEGEYEKQDAYENISLSLRVRFQF